MQGCPEWCVSYFFIKSYGSKVTRIYCVNYGIFSIAGEIHANEY